MLTVYIEIVIKREGEGGRAREISPLEVKSACYTCKNQGSVLSNHVTADNHLPSYSVLIYIKQINKSLRKKKNTRL